MSIAPPTNGEFDMIQEDPKPNAPNQPNQPNQPAEAPTTPPAA